MTMTETELADFYRDYIACLNAQDWPGLWQFVAHDVVHNGRAFGLAGYRAMLENDFRDIPDLSSPSNCSPATRQRRGEAGDRLHASGRIPGSARQRQAPRFSENVFYELRDAQDRAGVVRHRQGGDRGAALDACAAAASRRCRPSSASGATLCRARS